MEYIVKINPAKEKEFLQLLKAWESLGVVLHHELMEQELSEEEVAGYEFRKPKKKHAETAWEMAEPYKDLLD